MAVLIPCLEQLRADINALAPNRSKASDGWIGDAAHRQRSSDHNPDETGKVPIQDADKKDEVHAVDVDKDLNESDLTMEKVVQFLLARCRSGAENRLRYVIYNRRIWSASSDWTQKAYNGSSPHTEHAHFSASYETAREANTASWHLEEIPVSLTAADKTWLSTELRKQADAALAAKLDDIATEVMTKHKVPGTNAPGNTYVRAADDILADLFCLLFFGHTKGKDPIPEDGVFGVILAKLEELSTQVAELEVEPDQTPE